MHKAQHQVREFHEKVTGAPVSSAHPELRLAVLRARLQLEEAFETAVALVGLADAQVIAQEQILAVSAKCARAGKTDPSLEDTIDGLCDTIVIAYGTAECIGIDLEPFFDEVMAANMRKAEGPVRSDGKKEKPAGWVGPDIAKVLNEHKGKQK